MSVMAESMRHVACREQAKGIRTPEYPRRGEDLAEWADREYRAEIAASLERIRLAGGWKELAARAGISVQRVSEAAHNPELWRGEDMRALFALDPDTSVMWRFRHIEDVVRGCEINNEFLPGEPLVMRGSSCAH